MLMAYEEQMRQIARQLVTKHGDLSEVNCVSGNNPCQIELIFADGKKIDVGEHSGQVDLSMMKAGYHGTGSRCFYAFLDEAGFDLTFEQVAKMKNGTVLRRSPKPSVGDGKEFNGTALEEMILKGDMQALTQTMEDHPFETVSALEKLEDKRGVEPLIAILKSGKYGKGHRAVVVALKNIGDERAVEPLAQALSDVDVVVRQEAAEALARIADERVVKQLTQALQDQNYVVRDYAAAALKRISGAKELESLVQNLENLHGDARWKTAEAILNIGGKNAVEPLLQLLKDESREVRTIAARGLGSIGGTRAVEPLILTLKDIDSDVRTTAATALGRLGDARAVEPLILALKGQDGQVRWMAAEALGNLGDKRATGPLTVALKDSKVGVQSKAKEALAKIRPIPAPELQTGPAAGLSIAEPGTIKNMAIASLVLSISALPFSICGFGIFFPPIAVILGLIAYVQSRKSNSPRNIRRMALAGTILGGLLTLIFVLLLIGSLLLPNGLDLIGQ
jgi:HEAT repeat protein